MPTLFGRRSLASLFSDFSRLPPRPSCSMIAVERKEPQTSRGEKRSGGMGAPLIIRGLPRSLETAARVDNVFHSKD
jgi:hypothetical protein